MIQSLLKNIDGREGLNGMLHISICDDEKLAVEKMQRIVENVLERSNYQQNLRFLKMGKSF